MGRRVASPWLLGSWGVGALFWVVVAMVLATVVAMVRAVTSFRRLRSLSSWDLKVRRSFGKVEGAGSWGWEGMGGVAVRAWSCLTRRRRASRSFLNVRRSVVRVVRSGVVVVAGTDRFGVWRGDGNGKAALSAGLGCPGSWFLLPGTGGRGGDILW